MIGKREKKSKNKYEVKYHSRRVLSVPNVLFLYGLTSKTDQKTRRKGILAWNQSIWSNGAVSRDYVRLQPRAKLLDAVIIRRVENCICMHALAGELGSEELQDGY